MTQLPSAAVLSRRVMEVLANAAFIFAEPTDESRSLGDDVVVARLVLQHGEGAELCVLAEPSLAAVLAANLLGTESDTPEAQGAARDAVGELTNILAGNLAVDLFGKDVVAHIGIPLVTAEPDSVARERLATASCRACLVTDEGFALTVALAAAPAP